MDGRHEASAENGKDSEFECWDQRLIHVCKICKEQKMFLNYVPVFMN